MKQEREFVVDGGEFLWRGHNDNAYAPIIISNNEIE